MGYYVTGAVGAVVVYHDEFVADLRLGELLVEGANQGGDVAGFVVGGDDQTQGDGRVVFGEDVLG